MGGLLYRWRLRWMRLCGLSVSGMLQNGKKFDSSRDRNKPFKFKIGRQEVIKGWEEGVAQVRQDTCSRTLTHTGVTQHSGLTFITPSPSSLHTRQMSLGQRAKITCTPDMAYGATGHPGVIPPNATLIFDVELLKLEWGWRCLRFRGSCGSKVTGAMYSTPYSQREGFTMDWATPPQNNCPLLELKASSTQHLKESTALLPTSVNVDAAF